MVRKIDVAPSCRIHQDPARRGNINFVLVAVTKILIVILKSRFSEYFVLIQKS